MGGINPFYNRQDEWAYYHPLVGSRMLELGGKINAGLTYKAFFESQGIEHVSVDWNGEHGALVRDLRQPLWEELGQFDMVTNIGTTEHVDDQKGVWENIHWMTKPGGVLVSVTPYPDGRNWWWHGLYYPTEAFFLQFAAWNGWVIERIGADLPEPNRNLYVRLRRRENTTGWDFIMPMGTIVRNQIRPR